MFSRVSLAEEAPVPFTVKPYTGGQKKYYKLLPRPFLEVYTYTDHSIILKQALDEKPKSNIPHSVEELIGDPGASWIVVKFENYNLGKMSWLTISSLSDTEQIQKFDQVSLDRWGGQSAMFNGNQLKIELFVMPTDKDVFYNIKEILVGDFRKNSESNNSNENTEKESSLQSADGREDICGNIDDRVASSDKRIGRIMPFGCTGWALKNGAYLSAGHCVNSRFKYLQFNIPQSFEDGTPVHPPINDQYFIVPESIEHISGGVGNDWAVFSVVPGSDGLMPHQKYGSFELSTSNDSGVVEVAGYGVDDSPTGKPPEFFNATSQTQQKDNGDLLKVDIVNENKVIVNHRVDTRKGNSGSPIYLKNKPSVAIGIHTHNGCSDSRFNNANRGTGFSNQKLLQAIMRKGDFY